LSGTDAHASVFSDGAARGNPGPAAFGVVIKDADGHDLYRKGETIGEATNNVAEYRGVLHALETAKALGLTRFTLYLDSELIERQLQGRYRVKSPHLVPLFRRARLLIDGFERVHVRHVRRDLNADADALANAALDGRDAG
jgi:ribonuclease HI